MTIEANKTTVKYPARLRKRQEKMAQGRQWRAEEVEAEKRRQQRDAENARLEALMRAEDEADPDGAAERARARYSVGVQMAAFAMAASHRRFR